HTITTRAGIVAELERIREAGYSVDNEERNRGVTCMAVLLPTDDAPTLALSVSAPSAELAPSDQETLLPVLRAAAAELDGLTGSQAALAPLRTRMVLPSSSTCTATAINPSTGATSTKTTGRMPTAASRTRSSPHSLTAR